MENKKKKIVEIVNELFKGKDINFDTNPEFKERMDKIKDDILWQQTQPIREQIQRHEEMMRNASRDIRRAKGLE